MEAATVTRQAPPEPPASHDGAAEATRSTEELFQWSTYVDVGAGATECEHARDGTCADPSHFHCWLCLPNSFQFRDVSAKADAAKARKRRALMQTGENGGEPTDSALVLEDRLAVWSANEHTRQALVARIANRNVEAQLSEIADELIESEQFEHHAADLEEWRRLARLPEGERDAEEWQRLNDDMEAYGKAMDEHAQSRFEREKEVLSKTPHEELVELERRWMIDATAQDTWNHVYYTWAYYTCARVPVTEGYPAERVFAEPEYLKNTAPETLEAIKTAYRSLESRMLVRGDAAGN